MSEDLEQPMGEREQALRSIKKRRDFTGHLVAFVVVNAAIWGIWAFTGSGDPWPAWITGLWGIGLIMNAWDVFGRRPVTEEDVQREIHRLHPKER